VVEVVDVEVVEVEVEVVEVVDVEVVEVVEVEVVDVEVVDGIKQPLNVVLAPNSASTPLSPGLQNPL
jgi:hypothetical protein